jgi:hypothetical protein
MGMASLKIKNDSSIKPILIIYATNVYLIHTHFLRGCGYKESFAYMQSISSYMVPAIIIGCLFVNFVKKDKE